MAEPIDEEQEQFFNQFEATFGKILDRRLEANRKTMADIMTGAIMDLGPVEALKITQDDKLREVIAHIGHHCFELGFMDVIEVNYPDEHGPGTPTLGPTESHPAAHGAIGWFRDFVKSQPMEYIAIKTVLYQMRDSIAEPDHDRRMWEICIGTIERLAMGEPVSDRYLLGLCWVLRDLKDGGAFK